MITCDPNSPLGFIARQVDELKVGECLAVNKMDLADIPSYTHNESLFTPTHRVLGVIVGSTWTHSFVDDRWSDSVIFRRHEDKGIVRWDQPDDEYRRKRIL